MLGEIPGVVAFVGCANFANGGKEVAEMSVEFAKRRYIVCTSGCAAMSIGMYRDEEGKTPYEQFPGSFTAGGIVNVGSCVANAHIAGATIKIASIFARRNLRGNYTEIADYVHNRVGAVGVAWGAMSQKAAAIASGFWRLGIPVVVGPHGTSTGGCFWGVPIMMPTGTCTTSGREKMSMQARRRNTSLSRQRPGKRRWCLSQNSACGLTIQAGAGQ